MSVVSWCSLLLVFEEVVATPLPRRRRSIRLTMMARLYHLDNYRIRNLRNRFSLEKTEMLTWGLAWGRKFNHAHHPYPLL